MKIEQYAARYHALVIDLVRFDPPDNAFDLYYREMMKQKLSARLVDTIQPPKVRRIEIHDELLSGLRLRIYPTGKKVYSIVHRLDGQQIRHTIGTHPAIGLAQAREAAREVLRNMQLGTYRRACDIEPVPQVRTLGATVPEFIAKYAKPKNRTWQQTQTILQRFSPLFDKPLAEIRRGDVVRVLDDMIASGTPHRANRALAAIKKLFAWSLDRGYVEVHPIAGLKPPTKENVRDRILTDAEMRLLMQSAEGMGYPFGPAVQVFLLTGQRRGEVGSMRWSHVDFDRAIWTIPASVAKNGRVHEVPLSTPVVDLLRSLPRFVNCDLVFTTTGITPISGLGKVKERLDAALGVSDWRFHDLRRTAASGMARLGTPPHVIEKVLNHQTGLISGVAAIYNRHGYNAEKRNALEEWARHVVENA